MTTEVDGLFICPYNKSHMITPHKLPNHLVKCRKNNPALAQNIVVCPYNQCHHIPREELEEHFSNCKEYHTFQALSLKPSTDYPFLHIAPGEGLSCRPLKNTDMLEQEQIRYVSHRTNFSGPPKLHDPGQAAVQQQRNLEDLDEWFVE